MSDRLFTVSLKGQQAHQAWVVINADTADDLAGAIDALLAEGDGGDSLLQQIADANSIYQGVANVANPGATRAPAPAGSDAPTQVPQAGPTTPARQDSPPAQSSYARRKASAGTGGRGGQKDNEVASGVTPEPCAHGDRTYRDGGRWKAWFCPSPKGTPGQCEPLWVRD